MEEEIIKPLILAWWNTSFSPLGKTRSSANQKIFGIRLIKDLFINLNVDLLALGEVCTQDIEEIIKEIGIPSLSYHDATQSSGKAKFDIAVIYKRDRFKLKDFNSSLDSFGDSTLKIGEQITFLLKEIDQNINIYVSHWPSRMFCAENSPKRIEIATALRRSIEKLKLKYNDPQFVVLMGDYNDEPFSPSLSHHILGTRDRELAKESDRYLYNPFWRKLGEKEPLSENDKSKSICGTYFYNNKGEHTRWFTFDQILFSSAFLQNNTMTLNETLTQIINSDELELRIKNSQEIFDHFPVLSVINIRSNI